MVQYCNGLVMLEDWSKRWIISARRSTWPDRNTVFCDSQSGERKKSERSGDRWRRRGDDDEPDRGPALKKRMTCL